MLKQKQQQNKYLVRNYQTCKGTMVNKMHKGNMQKPLKVVSSK